jgi:hypothetical protein
LEPAPAEVLMLRQLAAATCLLLHEKQRKILGWFTAVIGLEFFHRAWETFDLHFDRDVNVFVRHTINANIDFLMFQNIHIPDADAVARGVYQIGLVGGQNHFVIDGDFVGLQLTHVFEWNREFFVFQQHAVVMLTLSHAKVGFILFDGPTICGKIGRHGLLCKQCAGDGKNNASVCFQECHKYYFLKSSNDYISNNISCP